MDGDKKENWCWAAYQQQQQKQQQQQQQHCIKKTEKDISDAKFFLERSERKLTQKSKRNCSSFRKFDDNLKQNNIW
jgi:hypothetical protein